MGASPSLFAHTGHRRPPCLSLLLSYSLPHSSRSLQFASIFLVCVHPNANPAGIFHYLPVDCTQPGGTAAWSDRSPRYLLACYSTCAV
ncbi:hypothetical protein FKP32DRAFT_1649450 [Trametes sanguinea]|nr:hypothetical protein FKP32DRAFT_1649450 [Trametes sanguinea]